MNINIDKNLINKTLLNGINKEKLNKIRLEDEFLFNIIVKANNIYHMEQFFESYFKTLINLDELGYDSTIFDLSTIIQQNLYYNGTDYNKSNVINKFVDFIKEYEINYLKIHYFRKIISKNFENKNFGQDYQSILESNEIDSIIEITSMGFVNLNFDLIFHLTLLSYVNELYDIYDEIFKQSKRIHFINDHLNFEQYINKIEKKIVEIEKISLKENIKYIENDYQVSDSILRKIILGFEDIVRKTILWLNDCNFYFKMIKAYKNGIRINEIKYEFEEFKDRISKINIKNNKEKYDEIYEFVDNFINELEVICNDKF